LLRPLETPGEVGGSQLDQATPLERVILAAAQHCADGAASDGSIDRGFAHVVEDALEFSELGLVAGAVQELEFDEVSTT